MQANTRWLVPANHNNREVGWHLSEQDLRITMIKTAKIKGPLPLKKGQTTYGSVFYADGIPGEAPNSGIECDYYASLLIVSIPYSLNFQRGKKRIDDSDKKIIHFKGI